MQEYGFYCAWSLTTVLVSHDPIYEAWDKAGIGIVISAIIFVLSITVSILFRNIENKQIKNTLIILIIVFGLIEL